MFGSFNAAITALIAIALAVVPIVDYIKAVLEEQGHKPGKGGTLAVVVCVGMVLSFGFYYFPMMPTFVQVPIAGAAIALDAAGIFKLSDRPS